MWFEIQMQMLKWIFAFTIYMFTIAGIYPHRTSSHHDDPSSFTFQSGPVPLHPSTLSSFPCISSSLPNCMTTWNIHSTFIRVDNLLKPLVRGAVYLPCIQPKKHIPNDILKWYFQFEMRIYRRHIGIRTIATATANTRNCLSIFDGSENKESHLAMPTSE